MGELLPGDSFSINPTITNKSTGSSYVFLRIDCSSIDGKPIYSFTPTGENAGDWTVVENDDVDGILVVYGDSSTCTVFEPDEVLKLTGKVTLDISYKDYADLENSENLKATFHVCGVHKDKVGSEGATGESPADAYGEYLRLGGE